MRGGRHGTGSRIAGSAAVIGLLMNSPLAVAQPSPVGINAAVHNSVQIRRGIEPPKVAIVRERVLLNDEVRTGAASQLQILLLDNSTFTVGANARVSVDRFVYDGRSRNVGINVAQGAFRFMSGRTLTKAAGPVSVRTPVGSVGIRGTIFEGVVGADAMRIGLAEPAVGNVPNDPKTSTLVLLRGPGPHVQGDALPGAVDVTIGRRIVVLDRPNLAVFVPGVGMAPIGPFEISPAGLASLQGLLRTIPVSPGAVAQPGESSWPGPASGSLSTAAAGLSGTASGGASNAGGASGSILGTSSTALAATLGALALGVVAATSKGSNQRPVSP